MTSYIDASSPSGNGRRIELLGTDLIFDSIDNVFVYPSLDVNRLRRALSRTLSFWPILTGRVLFDGNDEYFIELSDKSIPFTYAEDDELDRWPDLPILVDDVTKIHPFIDSVRYKPEVEPLLRIKVTRLLRSDEVVLGTSFQHMVGDAQSNIHFLNDLSQIYQDLQPVLPRPVFERPLLNKKDADFSLLPQMKNFQNADKRESILARLSKEQTETDAVNISFSSEQLKKLHRLIVTINKELTIHDALCAYLVFLMNKHVLTNGNECIRRAYMYINYRGVNLSLTPEGYVANAIIQPLSCDFSDPLSLISIAETIRQLIKTTREEEFLRKRVTLSNILMRQVIKEGRANFVWDKDEVVFNSNHKYDWANQVNFGMKNQCRFHTTGIFKYYFRIFQLNPVRNENGNWIKDNGGVEVAFRIPKGEKKEKFLKGLNEDFNEDFINVK